MQGVYMKTSLYVLYPVQDFISILRDPPAPPGQLAAPAAAWTMPKLLFSLSRSDSFSETDRCVVSWRIRLYWQPI